MSNWHQSREYRIWRAGIIRRDKVCQICGSRQNRQAHHIFSGSYYPEKRYNLENGVCLCRDCHDRFHYDYKQSSRKTCNDKDYENFKSIAKFYMELKRGGDK